MKKQRYNVKDRMRIALGPANSRSVNFLGHFCDSLSPDHAKNQKITKLQISTH